MKTLSHSFASPVDKNWKGLIFWTLFAVANRSACYFPNFGEFSHLDLLLVLLLSASSNYSWTRYRARPQAVTTCKLSWAEWFIDWFILYRILIEDASVSFSVPHLLSHGLFRVHGTFVKVYDDGTQSIPLVVCSVSHSVHGYLGIYTKWLNALFCLDCWQISPWWYRGHGSLRNPASPVATCPCLQQ